MESEVIFNLGSVFIVESVDYSGKQPVIHLLEVAESEQIPLERSDAMRHMQTSHSVHSDLQGVPQRNTERDIGGSIQPQSSASQRQRDTVRGEGRQGAVLSTTRQEQVNISTEAGSDESASFMPENNDSVITELSAENPKYDMIEDIGAQMAGVVRKTDQIYMV